MKIVFLGTSHGVPEKTHFCSCTMIETGGSRYLVDAGGPVIDLLIRADIPLETIKGIFITHPHGDHTNGLNAFADLHTWYFKTPEPRIFLPDMKLAAAIDSWINATMSGECSRLRFEPFSEGKVFEDENIAVSAVPTEHCPHSFAFEVEAEGRRLVFTGDLADPHRDFPDICFRKHCDLIVCEAAHFDLTEAEDVFDRCEADRIVINHINPRRNAANAETVKAKKHAYLFETAYDGMELTL